MDPERPPTLHKMNGYQHIVDVILVWVDVNVTNVSHLSAKSTKTVTSLVHREPATLSSEFRAHSELGSCKEIKLLTEILNVHFAMLEKTHPPSNHLDKIGQQTYKDDFHSKPYWMMLQVTIDHLK